MYAPDADLAACNVKRQKREYLKGGCRECKRRKIKCNEEKPQCWQCTRLKKQCSYPFAGEKVARVSKRDRKSRLYCNPDNSGGDCQFGAANATPLTASSNETSPGDSGLRDLHLHTTTPGVLNGSQLNVLPSLLYPPVIEAPQIQTPGYENSTFNSYDARPNSLPTQAAQSAQHPFQPWPITYQHNLAPQTAALHPLLLQTYPYSPTTHQHAHGLFSQAHHGMSGALYAPYTQPPPPGQYHHNILPLPQKGTMEYFKQHERMPVYLNPAMAMNPHATTPTPMPVSAPNSAVTDHASIGDAMSDTTLRPDSTGDSSSMLDFFSQDDLNMIATDLNEIVQRMVVDTKGIHNAVSEDSLHECRLLVTEAAPFGGVASKQEPPYPRNIAPNLIEVRGELEESYLNEYHSSFAYLVLPFGCHDKKMNTFVNPVRDVTLQKASHEPFLLAAVLAHGARLLYEKHHRPRDQDAYCTYLNICLQMLEPSLERSRDHRRAINANIEAVLITVLLLTSASAALSCTEWRFHLRGAKELLLRHQAKNARSSPVLVLCKMWFVTLEYLASISSALGGTIDLDEEMNLLCAMGDPYEVLVLRKWGIVDESNFNVFVGIDHDLLSIQQELLEFMRKVRIQQQPFDKDPLFVLRMFSQMFAKGQIVYLSASCVVAKDSLSAEARQKMFLTDEFTLNGEVYVVSWRDISNQAYVLGGLIYVLLQFFGETYDAPQVQTMVRKIISNVERLSEVHYNTNNPIMYCAPIMLHWPMLIAGVLLMDKSKRFVIERYFEACQTRGLSASHRTLARIRRVWDERDRGIFNDPLATDGSDTISY